MRFYRKASIIAKFQSTHPRRVRPLWTYTTPPTMSFNPRTHVGCDNVSSLTSPNVGFQSTHPRRVRLCLHRSLMHWVMFQSTHPRRVRLKLLILLQIQKSFNPRTHVGCDLHALLRDIRAYMFQSTHPRRVRLRELSCRIPNFVSIHAPT